MTDFPLPALVLPEPAASQAWHAWRATLDIDALSYESQQLIPALAARLPQWLAEDACAARFQGIVKMAWSRNQLRLMRAAEVQQTLLRQALEPALIAGPAAWTLLTRDEGAVRFIPHLTFVIIREHVSKAAAVLAADGWELCGEIPRASALDWVDRVSLIKGDDTLHLHWRLFPAPHGEAGACERACLENSRPLAWNRQTFRALSAEADLLHRLTNRADWDPVDWQADVLMTPFDAVDWNRFRALSQRFAPEARPRLMALRRDFGLPVPEIAPAGIGPKNGGLIDNARTAAPAARRGGVARFLLGISRRFTS